MFDQILVTTTNLLINSSIDFTEFQYFVEQQIIKTYKYLIGVRTTDFFFFNFLLGTFKSINLEDLSLEDLHSSWNRFIDLTILFDLLHLRPFDMEKVRPYSFNKLVESYSFLFYF